MQPSPIHFSNLWRTFIKKSMKVMKVEYIKQFFCGPNCFRSPEERTPRVIAQLNEARSSVWVYSKLRRTVYGNIDRGFDNSSGGLATWQWWWLPFRLLKVSTMSLWTVACVAWRFLSKLSALGKRGTRSSRLRLSFPPNRKTESPSYAGYLDCTSPEDTHGQSRFTYSWKLQVWSNE